MGRTAGEHETRSRESWMRRERRRQERSLLQQRRELEKAQHHGRHSQAEQEQRLQAAVLAEEGLHFEARMQELLREDQLLVEESGDQVRLVIEKLEQIRQDEEREQDILERRQGLVGEQDRRWHRAQQRAAELVGEDRRRFAQDLSENRLLTPSWGPVDLGQQGAAVAVAASHSSSSDSSSSSSTSDRVLAYPARRPSQEYRGAPVRVDRGGVSEEFVFHAASPRLSLGASLPPVPAGWAGAEAGASGHDGSSGSEGLGLSEGLRQDAERLGLGELLRR